MRDSITVERIDNALAHLGGCIYGTAIECDRSIADRRLRLHAG